MLPKSNNTTSSKFALSILKNDFTSQEDLLFLFSIYIASNPDFKYNATYLTDSIDLFLSDYANFKEKISIFYLIIDYIKIKKPNSIDLEIVFDNKYKYCTASSLDLEYPEVFNDHNIHKIGQKEFFIKINLLNPQIEYTFLIKLDKKENWNWESKINDFFNTLEKQFNEKK